MTPTNGEKIKLEENSLVLGDEEHLGREFQKQSLEMIE